ncbi:serine hydrolase domain-containing protein [Streptomyces hygroscopicus]|uniref:serine hydrolase domain-containing protein n=1 Tax=Streptomyces hygroscopicus TaxID=1912 RepID=UPI0009A04105|nr:serine hydrolase domain-containing protein [Streptomyces hygroscopicus]
MTSTQRPSPAKTRITSRIVATALVTGLAGLAGLTGLAGQSVAAPTASAASPTPATASAKESPRTALRKDVDAITRTGSVGVIAQSSGPRGHYSAAAGVADTTTRERARAGDRFRIGSATKTFVSTVMLQLVGEGRVSLDDTVDRWLPGVVSGNGNDGRHITVRQLLQHTSGLYDYTADFPEMTTANGFQADRYTTWTPEQLVAIATRHKPNFAPGTNWAYANTNYVLAGVIIEKATGHSWQQEVTRRIIHPLGLRNTLAPTTQPRIPGPHLRGYSNFYGTGETMDVTDLNPSAAGAAGAMVSTTGDLSRFYSALLGGRLLRPAQLSAMKTTVRAEGLDAVWPGARYGLGLQEVPLSCGGSYYTHGGDIPGFSTRSGASADGRRVVVVATTGDTAPDQSTEKAKNALVDRALCASGGK